MEVYGFVLCCTLLVSVAAFTIPDNLPKHSKNVSFLETAASPDCKCKNGRCVTDNRGKTKCNCAPGYALQDEFTCEICNCGKKGRCIFMPQPKSSGRTQFVKKCICDVGSAEKDGLCIDCHCGEHSKCEFEGEEKVCYCIEGFSEKDGVCTECNCGFFGECKFELGRKKCTCDQGYVEEDEHCTAICSKVDCGIDAECQFDTSNNIPKCTCKMPELVFDESDRKCKETCDHFEVSKRCQNGGACVENESGNFCSCKDGTSGFFCEIVEGCSELHCGEEAMCEFDLKYEAARCKCTDYLRYDERDKKCKETCENFGDPPKRCHNGGDCVENESGNFCSCRDGTSGFFCEIVEGCFEIDCGEEALCEFDLNDEAARCKCIANHLRYDDTDKKCKEKCDMYYRPCHNGGHCNEDICDCLPGTSGDSCEIIDACYYLCPKQRDINCTYDIEKERAICKCIDEELGYNPEIRQCRPHCNENPFVCMNGAHCEIKSNHGFCQCLAGTEGDFCEKITECESKDCGPEANCEYDINKGGAICVCHDIALAFDSEDRKCKNTCSDSSECENGGSCVRVEEYVQFCRCLDGTKGDFCEEVTGCITKDCGDHAKCVYDVRMQIAVCVCEDERYAFDPISYKCRLQCDDYSYLCRNGGICEANGNSRFCKCSAGTDGDLCENVSGCRGKDCGPEAECKYDVDRGLAVCTCRDKALSFHEVDGRCRNSCQKETDCKNGGECTEWGHAKFCLCLDGTTGDACDIIEECEKDHRKCKGESQCNYDIERRTAYCKCDNASKAYDPLDEKCKHPCHSNANCRHQGLCMKLEDSSFCRCKIGTSGELCERVDGCEQGACGDTETTTCKYDIEKEAVKCGCKDADALYDEVTKTCKTCDCGKNTISCTFKDGEKVCVCPEDFGVENGLCKKKYCMEKTCLNGKCEIIDDKEVCSCFEGYELDGNYCKKLNCTNTPCINGTCVVRYGLIEKCVCPAGFTLNRGTCIRGLCRPDTCYGGRCEMVEGELICICPDKFHLEGIGCYETVCEIQRCFGGKCVVEDGKEICTCREGYVLKNDVCKKILCEKKNCFGGQCNIVDGEEECTCPEGFSLFEDVCRENSRIKKTQEAD